MSVRKPNKAILICDKELMKNNLLLKIKEKIKIVHEMYIISSILNNMKPLVI